MGKLKNNTFGFDTFYEPVNICSKLLILKVLRKNIGYVQTLTRPKTLKIKSLFSQYISCINISSWVSKKSSRAKFRAWAIPFVITGNPITSDFKLFWLSILNLHACCNSNKPNDRAYSTIWLGLSLR